MAGDGSSPDQGLSTISRTKSSFQYVRVPADTHEPLQQLELAVPPGKDVECLLDHLKAYFAAGGFGTGVSEVAQKAARKKVRHLARASLA
jgi:hypothetical protein